MPAHPQPAAPPPRGSVQQRAPSGGAGVAAAAVLVRAGTGGPVLSGGAPCGPGGGCPPACAVVPCPRPVLRSAPAPGPGAASAALRRRSAVGARSASPPSFASPALAGRGRCAPVAVPASGVCVALAGPLGAPGSVVPFRGPVPLPRLLWPAWGVLGRPGWVARAAASGGARVPPPGPLRAPPPRGGGPAWCAAGGPLLVAPSLRGAGAPRGRPPAAWWAAAAWGRGPGDVRGLRAAQQPWRAAAIRRMLSMALQSKNCQIGRG